jgi:hypothetical protein
MTLPTVTSETWARTVDGAAQPVVVLFTAPW